MNPTTALYVLTGLLWLSAAAIAAPASDIPDARPPGPAFTPPQRPAAPDGPRVFEHTGEAGPDETFFVVGEGLSDRLTAWGAGPEAGGQQVVPEVQLNNGHYLAATLPQTCHDGVFVVRVRSEKGSSKPIVLNAPQAWWLLPARAVPGGELAIFGRNLARRPDFDRSTIYLQREGSDGGRFLEAADCGKYRLRVVLPEDLQPGNYGLWVHAGQGGVFGWSNPLKLSVALPPEAPDEIAVAEPTRAALAQAVAAAEQAGGAVVKLPRGVIELDETLKLRAGVVLAGAGPGETVLRFVPGNAQQYVLRTAGGWGHGIRTGRNPNTRHLPDYTIDWTVRVPAAGRYTLHLRYACDMSWWQQPGVSGKMAVSVDGAEPVPLENLPNTGGYEWYRWSPAAQLELDAGEQRLRWHHLELGQITLDAMVLAAHGSFTPSDDPFPVSGPGIVVVQAEDLDHPQTTPVTLPGVEHPAVWLCGDNAGLRDLSVQGCAATDTGVLIRHQDFPRWIEGCTVEGVKLSGVEGKRTRNRGVHLCYASRASVQRCEVWGRSPIYMAGVRQCTIAGNRLVTQTRIGGGAEAAIVGRTNILEHCVVENNVVASPPGRRAGTGTTRRLLWVSTGHGSVSENYFAGNRAERAHFGGLPGSDQNVGETILLEACQRIAFHGAIESADAQSVTLPATVPATPDELLGTVVRSALPVDSAGRETPFWPPEDAEDDGLFEPTIGQYYVTVIKGRGLGQTRRAVARRGRTILLDRPWAEPPGRGATVLVSTLFYRNLIVDNEACEGMSGIQLWFSCVQNVVSDNVVRRQRGGGLVLVGACSTLASSMPTMWNRGLAPCYFNTFEGNLTENTTGSSLSGGGLGDFPLALGNVVRHNSFLENRGSGLSLSGSSRGSADAPPRTAGTIVELNVVRNVHESAYRVRSGADYVVLRRNAACFWQRFAPDLKPAAFQLDTPGTYALEHNVMETRHPARGTRPVMERHVEQAQ